MTRRLGTCLLGLVVLLVAAASVGALGVPGAAQTDAGPQPQTTPEGFDSTQFELTVYENTSVRWTVQHSRTLNESEIDQFRAFAADFRQTETTTYTRFQSRARNLTAFGEEATGRSMAASGFARNASIVELGPTRGTIEMSFVWENFARTTNDRVIVDDVFQGGMYVGDGQRLVVERGPDLAFASVEPSPDSMARRGDLEASETVTWVGEVRFNDQRPWIVMQPREAATGGEGPAQGENGGESANDGDSGGMTPILVAGGVLLLLLAVGLVWYAGYLPVRGPDALSGGTTADSGATGASSGDTASPTEPAAGGGGAAAAAQVPQEELLSDEDRVLQLLDENGGRMKQVDIVEETEWSKSKVSMLLSDMEEADQISKLRLGRENIISLAGQEPDAAGSPFEDEE